MSSRLPLVVILGSTGSGKTKLSLELAKKFGGEIIGADSMQIYKGLDIITAKATPEELRSVPHHFIDELDPEHNFNVKDFRNRALPIVERLLKNGKLPIVVGGTNYYIESLLWKVLIDKDNSNASSYEDDEIEDGQPSAQLHAELAKLDPKRAHQLHPNNKRKITRSLQIIRQHSGRSHTDILQEQFASEGGSVFGGGLRYDNSLVLWLHCEQDTLNERIDARTDAMLTDGLVAELENFHARYIKSLGTDTPDYTRGIYQTIGLKEFRNYLHGSGDRKQLLNDAIEALKLATRRYSKRQLKWVKKRFLTKTDRPVPPVYELDVNDVDKWDHLVRLPAEEIVQAYTAGGGDAVECLRYAPLKLVEATVHPNSLDETFVCETCQRVFVGQFQWSEHLKSKRHKKHANKKQKLETNTD